MTTPTVFEAFSRVMEDVQAIEKRERNQEQNFMYRGVDTVMDNVGPVLRRHRVFIIPDAESLEVERYQNKKGTAMKNVTVRMRYTVYGPAGDSFTGSAYGEAADAGDKAVSKAESVAYRVFLTQGLTIPTHAPDPDADTHERAADPEQTTSPADAARNDLLQVLHSKGIEPWRAIERFAADNNGRHIQACKDPKPIRALIDFYMNSEDDADV